jgi:hypothetical protein
MFVFSNLPSVGFGMARVSLIVGIRIYWIVGLWTGEYISDYFCWIVLIKQLLDEVKQTIISWEMG